jgi:hypothetical protein
MLRTSTTDLLSAVIDAARDVLNDPATGVPHLGEGGAVPVVRVGGSIEAAVAGNVRSLAGLVCLVTYVAQDPIRAAAARTMSGNSTAETLPVACVLLLRRKGRGEDVAVLEDLDLAGDCLSEGLEKRGRDRAWIAQTGVHRLAYQGTGALASDSDWRGRSVTFDLTRLRRYV